MLFFIINKVTDVLETFRSSICIISRNLLRTKPVVGNTFSQEATEETGTVLEGCTKKLNSVLLNIKQLLKKSASSDIIIRKIISFPLSVNSFFLNKQIHAEHHQKLCSVVLCSGCRAKGESVPVHQLASAAGRSRVCLQLLLCV